MLQDLDFLVFAVFFIYGCMFLYNAWRLTKENKLFDSKVLYPGNCERRDCKDQEGYIRFIRPRLYATGAFCLVVAGYFVMNFYVDVPKLVSWLLMIPVLAFFGWTFWFFHKAAKRFW